MRHFPLVLLAATLALSARASAGSGRAEKTDDVRADEPRPDREPAPGSPDALGARIRELKDQVRILDESLQQALMRRAYLSKQIRAWRDVEDKRGRDLPALPSEDPPAAGKADGGVKTFTRLIDLLQREIADVERLLAEIDEDRTVLSQEVELLRTRRREANAAAAVSEPADPSQPALEQVTDRPAMAVPSDDEARGSTKPKGGP